MMSHFDVTFNVPVHEMIFVEKAKRLNCFSQNVSDLIIVQARFLLSQLVNQIRYRASRAQFHHKPELIVIGVLSLAQENSMKLG